MFLSETPAGAGSDLEEEAEVCDTCGMATSTLVRNNGEASYPIPAAFGGGVILPGASVICESAPAAVAAAFTAKLGDSISLRAVPSGQVGALPLLSAGQIPSGTTAATAALETAIGGVPVTAAQAISAVEASIASVLAAGIYVSSPITGTGSPQNIPHGLGVAPASVSVAAIDTTDAGIVAGGYAISLGTSTSSDVVLTATANLVFIVTAYA